MASTMPGLWQHMTLAVVLMCVCLSHTTIASTGAAKVRERIVRNPTILTTATPIPTEPIPDREPIDLSKLWGKWYLLNLASKCPYRLKHGSRVESTFVRFTPPEQPESSAISVSTNTRFNHDCWEIKQQYYSTENNGRYTLPGKKDAGTDTEIDIIKVDNAYAFILYRKQGMVTLKMYARATLNLSEPMLAEFEGIAKRHGMSLAYLFPFPTFGHCGPVDQRNVIDCVPTC